MPCAKNVFTATCMHRGRMKKGTASHCQVASLRRVLFIFNKCWYPILGKQCKNMETLYRDWRSVLRSWRILLQYLVQPFSQSLLLWVMAAIGRQGTKLPTFLAPKLELLMTGHLVVLPSFVQHLLTLFVPLSVLAKPLDVFTNPFHVSYQRPLDHLQQFKSCFGVRPVISYPRLDSLVDHIFTTHS